MGKKRQRRLSNRREGGTTQRKKGLKMKRKKHNGRSCFTRQRDLGGNIRGYKDYYQRVRKGADGEGDCALRVLKFLGQGARKLPGVTS